MDIDFADVLFVARFREYLTSKVGNNLNFFDVQG